MKLHLSAVEESFESSQRSASKLKGFAFSCVLIAVLSLACTVDEKQSGIPLNAQETINAFTADFNEGRFDKIYGESAEEWRAQVTLEQSNETFRRLKEQLGAIKERTFTSGRQQQKQSDNLPGNSLVVRYNAKFERAEGMESFTLIDRDGRYWLAGYSVSSNMLK